MSDFTSRPTGRTIHLPSICSSPETSMVAAFLRTCGKKYLAENVVQIVLPERLESRRVALPVGLCLDS